MEAVMEAVLDAVMKLVLGAVASYCCWGPIVLVLGARASVGRFSCGLRGTGTDGPHAENGAHPPLPPTSKKAHYPSVGKV